VAVRDLAAFSPAAALVGVVGWAYFNVAAAPMDEALVLVYPRLMAQGYVPYRDFQTFYGPGSPSILQLAYHYFGVGVPVERMTVIAYELLLVIGLYLLVRRFGRPVAGAASAAGALMLMQFPLPTTNWVLALAFLVLCLWCLAKIRDGSGLVYAVIAGGLAGYAITIRPELAAVALPSSLVLLIGLRRRAWLGFLAGLAVGVAPLVALVVAAGPDAAFSNLVVDALLRSGAGRRLPLFSSAIVGDAALVFLLIGPFLVLLAGIRARTRRGTGDRVLLSGGVLCLALIPETLARYDLSHLVFGGTITVAMLFAAAAETLRRPQETRPQRHILIAALMLAIAAVPLAMAAKNSSVAARIALDGGQPGFHTSDAMISWPVTSPLEARQIDAIVVAARSVTHPGDRLFVGPADLRRTYYNDDMFYALLPELTPATYYIEMEPFTANRPGSRLAGDVASADVLILTHRYDSLRAPDGSPDLGSDAPNEVVRGRFCLQVVQGPFDLYRRCGSH
jgi:hypothetical protein